MKKRAFPKDLKFGTYLPQRHGKSYLKLDDSAAALEQFFTEYFDGYATVKSNVSAGETDAIYVDSEHTAYLFRNVMSALLDQGSIDINITTTARNFVINFSLHSGRIEIKDIGIYRRLLDAAELSGFELSIVGNTISLKAELERGRVVISAITKLAFIESLKKVFFD